MAKHRSGKAKSTKEENAFFEGIRDALVEFNEDLQQGKKLTTRTVIKPNPPKSMKAADIVKLRIKLNVSQQVFADLLNASIRTVQAWEQGQKKPSGPSLRLLEIARNHPENLVHQI